MTEGSAFHLSGTCLKLNPTLHCTHKAHSSMGPTGNNWKVTELLTVHREEMSGIYDLW